ncbi:MAG: questin oxidase family protein [Pseudomonadota bacterium]|nr:questin oxidase family protein [Pseudomonadota bacterium]
MDKRAINNLINSDSHLDPEYGPKLTNHLPMALYALYDIGASDAQITQFAQDHIKARGLTPLTQKSTTIIDSQTYYSALGERRSFSAYNQFFDKEISTHGRDETLKRHINFLMHGVCGCAFHGLIRTAYGLTADNNEEISRGLAYWADTHKTITTHPATLSTNGLSLSDAFAAAQQLHQEGHWDNMAQRAPNIYTKIKQITDTRPFQSFIGQTPLNSQTNIDDFRRATLTLYQTFPNFTTLHCLTAVHALSGLYNTAAAPNDVLATMGQATLATYLSIGAPDLTPLQTPTNLSGKNLSAEWNVIRASHNDHAIKLAYSAREEYRATQDPAYLKIIKDIAAPKLP